jgi:hypothetical protein
MAESLFSHLLNAQSPTSKQASPTSKPASPASKPASPASKPGGEWTGKWFGEEQASPASPMFKLLRQHVSAESDVEMDCTTSKPAPVTAPMGAASSSGLAASTPPDAGAVTAVIGGGVELPVNDKDQMEAAKNKAEEKARQNKVTRAKQQNLDASTVMPPSPKVRKRPATVENNDSVVCKRPATAERKESLVCKRPAAAMKEPPRIRKKPAARVLDSEESLSDDHGVDHTSTEEDENKWVGFRRAADKTKASKAGDSWKRSQGEAEEPEEEGEDEPEEEGEEEDPEEETHEEHEEEEPEENEEEEPKLAELGNPSITHVGLQQWPPDAQNMDSLRLLKWLLDNETHASVTEAMYWHGLQLRGNVFEKGDIDSTLSLGRDVTSAIYIDAERKVHSKLEKRKPADGGHYNLVMTCKMTVNTKMTQISSSTILPDAAGKFNQLKVLRLCLAWNNVVNALSESKSGYPGDKVLELMIIEVKKWRNTAAPYDRRGEEV